MATATLTFQLPEEDEEFQQSINASKYHSVLWDTLQELRRVWKYGEDGPRADIYEEIYGIIYDSINSYGLGDEF